MKTINLLARKYNVDIEKAKELLAKKGVDVSDVDAELDLENEMLVEEILSVQQRFVQLQAGLKPGKMIETKVYPTYETKKDEMRGCSTILWIFVATLLFVIIIFFASMYSKARSEEISQIDKISSSSQSSDSGLSSVSEESSDSSNSMESLENYENTTFSYSWYDEATGKQWQYDTELSYELYEEYANEDFAQITQIASDNRAYEYFEDIVSEFSLACEKSQNPQSDLAAMVIGFVQSLDYDKNEEKEHAKYAYTTLYDKCGDDEDMAVLMATLLKISGNDAVILKFEGRYAVGLEIENADIDSAYFEFDSKKYVYVDTVTGSYAIGQIPSGYEQLNPEIIAFNLENPTL